MCRGRISVILILAIVGFNVMVWRWLQLAERELSLSWLDLQGVAMDMALSVAVAGLLLWLLRISRLGACIVAAAWALVHAFGYEYIRVFDSAPMLTYAHYLTDATFASGSGTHLSHPLLFTSLLAALLLATWNGRAVPRRWSLGLLTAGLLLLLGVGWSGAKLGPQEWRRQHLLQPSFVTLLRKQEPQEVSSDVAVPEFLSADLTGAPRIDLPGDAANVLLIVLEGVSGAFLPSLTQGGDWESNVIMPRLDELRQRGMLYTRFITQQRQTNRGTYSLLCGDLPKLDSSMPRMSDIANRGLSVDCLPRVLAEAGYHTAYWQAAPLAFMRKDAFMSLAGFMEIRGEADLPEAYRRTSWGVDDRAFFEQSLQRIQALQASSTPWFMTLMTAGTHHPYNIPDELAAEGDDRQQAFHILDEALHEFIANLEKQGVQEETLVLVTTDESSGVETSADDNLRRLSQNWGVLVALMPSGENSGVPVQSSYAQYDIPLSIVDYLGLEDSDNRFHGRSIFREYNEARPVIMANTYSRQQHLLEDDLLLVCQESGEGCAQYLWHADDLTSLVGLQQEPDYSMVKSLQQAVAYSKRNLGGVADRSVFELMPPGPVELQAREGNQVLFGGQAWDFPAGTNVEVVLEFSLKQGRGIKLQHSLLAGDKGFHHAKIPVLDAGDEHEVSYHVTFNDEAKGVNANLTVVQAGDQAALLEVTKAEMIIDWP